MSEKKGFFSRWFAKQEQSACCAVCIEEVSDETVTKLSSGRPDKSEAAEDEQATNKASAVSAQVR